jgi:hypothetical protein
MQKRRPQTLQRTQKYNPLPQVPAADVSEPADQHEDLEPSHCWYVCNRRVPVEKRLLGLRFFNALLFFLHLANCTAIIICIFTVGNNTQVPVTITTLTGRPGYGGYNSTQLYTMNPQWLSVTFAAICFVAHLIYWQLNDFYEALIRSQNNFLRWIEYSLSASIMLVQIAMLTGTTELTSLLNVFGTMFATIWFGQFTEEKYKESQRTKRWIAFVLGSIVTLFPWIGIFLTFGFSSAAPSNSFVIAIIFGQFSMFMLFAVISAINIAYLQDDYTIQSLIIRDTPAEDDTHEAFIPLVVYRAYQSEIDASNTKGYCEREILYNLLSFVVKTFLVWVTFAANL